MTDNFVAWTGNRNLATIGTNAGSIQIPFQGWKPFKEAFAPELIQEAVATSAIPVRSLFDPFGGSGTTALAAQFLGIHPTTIEVNPYLADVISAKLTTYDLPRLKKDFEWLLDTVIKDNSELALEAFLPPTFIEPGVKGRFIFNNQVAQKIFSITKWIKFLELAQHQRFFKVLLSGVLIESSNVRVSGKGRRYRQNWQGRQATASDLIGSFATHVQKAFSDLEQFNSRPCTGFDLLLGDSRKVNVSDQKPDLIVFSPPYPNSFDYTDVYNIELWMLGYLTDWSSNRSLRTSTLSSHVQVPRTFPDAPSGSETLQHALTDLDRAKDQLWDKRLPRMVGGYFSDLDLVIRRSLEILTTGGDLWMVVGDSRYGTTEVRVADILIELSTAYGTHLHEKRSFRSMRSSPQQGGREELAETLIVLRKDSESP